jgi:hypothetical protein
VHLSPEDDAKSASVKFTRASSIVMDELSEPLLQFDSHAAALIREATFALDCGCSSGRVEVADAQIKIVLADDKTAGAR